jgi:hypothetical protein
MYQVAADLRVWPLHKGGLVHVRDGAFLEPPSAAFEAASGRSSQVSSPTPLFAPVSALAASLVGAVGSAASGLGLARVASSPERQAVAGAPAVPASDLGPKGRAYIRNHLPLLDVPWTVKRQLDVAGINGLRTVTPASLRPLLRRLGQQRERAGGVGGTARVGALFEGLDAGAATELLEFCCGDLMQTAEIPAEAAAAPAAGAAAPAAAGAPTQLAEWRHPGRMRDLAGVPVPTAAGTIVPLGAGQLLVAPPAAGGHPVASGLLPASLGQEFVHPAAVEALAFHLRDPAFRSALRLQYYGVPQIAVHLRATLGPEWVASWGDAAAAWDRGGRGGPLAPWLRDAWRLCVAASSAAAEWSAGGAAASYDALGFLLLVPLADGRLLRASLLPAVLVADGGEDGEEGAGGGGGAAGQGPASGSGGGDRASASGGGALARAGWVSSSSWCPMH